MSASPRVLLADHDPLSRDLLRLVCGRFQICVIAEATTTEDLLELCESEQPDVVLTSSEVEAPIDAVLEALVATGARVLVLSDDRSPERLTSMLEKGASGYLLHDSAPESIAEAVLSVAAGEAALHPAAAVTLLQQWRALRRDGNRGGLNPRVSLTPREHDVLVAMADGLSTKAIARRLGTAVKTVENHKIRVFDKLGVSSQAHAVSLAIGQGLVTTGAAPEGEN